MKNNRKSSIKGNFERERNNEMLIIKNGVFSFDSNEKIEKKLILGMLSVHEHCIAFNKKQDISIWNYMLNEDKTKLFVFDEDDATIYDGFVIEAPQYIFEYGEIFAPVSFGELNLPNNIVNRKNFYLFENQIFRNMGNK